MMAATKVPPPQIHNDRRVHGWEKILRALIAMGADEDTSRRTLYRWKRRHGMPVRLAKNGRAWASYVELAEWWRRFGGALQRLRAV